MLEFFADVKGPRQLVGGTVPPEEGDSTIAIVVATVAVAIIAIVISVILIRKSSEKNGGKSH